MIQIGSYLITEKNLEKPAFRKKLLTRFSPEELLGLLVQAQLRISDLEDLNQRRYTDIMRRKTSCGGVTVDA